MMGLFTSVCNGFIVSFAVLLGYFFIRLSICLPSFSRSQTALISSNDVVPTVIVWGSGGHTTEMIFLLGRLNLNLFGPIHHVLSQTDNTSVKKIQSSKLPVGEVGTWHNIIRSREVKQSWISTVLTTFMSIVQCFLLVLRLRPRLIICNGPGTCVPICYSAFILHLIGVSDTKIVFVESFCRVDKLSLTGKLLYPIANRFIVQWPQLLIKYKRAEYLGDGRRLQEASKND